jgi:predicted short-subunit dehydrogenase-like oxidoreductase (DUF2520 family)
MIEKDVKPEKIVILGAGNLAFHIGQRLKKKGFDITQIVGRNPQHAKELAEILNAEYTCNLKLINKHADYYFICTDDNSILDISKVLRLPNKLVIHCSGTVERAVLNPISKKNAVIYPFQTFSKTRKIKWKNIPVLYETSQKSISDQIQKLILSFSKNTQEVNSKQRAELHLAAVLSGNFSNHLLYLVQNYLQKKNNPYFNLLFPLLEEIVEKAKKMNPFDAQTGPARRNDNSVLAYHQELVKDDENLKNLYSVFTKSIQKSYKKNLWKTSKKN